jgi:hypothetical protein
MECPRPPFVLLAPLLMPLGITNGCDINISVNDEEDENRDDDVLKDADQGVVAEGRVTPLRRQLAEDDAVDLLLGLEYAHASEACLVDQLTQRLGGDQERRQRQQESEPQSHGTFCCDVFASAHLSGGSHA